MAQNKNRIKRYGNIYDSRGQFRTIRVLLPMLLGIAVFAAVGWILYPPIHDAIMAMGEEKPLPPIASSQQPTASSPPKKESTSEAVTASSAPEEPVAVSPVGSVAFEGIYLPESVLQNATARKNFLLQAQKAGMKTVVVEMKDATGRVLYQSNHPIAKEVGAATETAFSAANIAEEIRSLGMTPAAKLHAFRDTSACSVRRELSVRYYDSEMLWMDNAPEQGGKYWMNPYLEEAQQYILSLVHELVQSGFDTILLDSVQFPSGEALDKAGYGETATTPRSVLLREFTQKAAAIPAGKGGKLILCLGGDWLGSPEEEQSVERTTRNSLLYGGSPTAFATAETLLLLPQEQSLAAYRMHEAKKAAPQLHWIAGISTESADGGSKSVAAVLDDYRSLSQNGYLLSHPAGNYTFS